MDILIKDIDILTLCDDNRYIKGGSIGIKDGYIDFVGSCEEEICEPSAHRVFSGKNKVAMPGLVNAHTHCSMTLLRNIADDLALEDWLFNHIFPKEEKLGPEDIYWGAQLGIIEMIKSGTTAFADMYLHMDSVARAVLDTGIRANLSRSPVNFVRGESCSGIDKKSGCFEFFNTWNGAANDRIKVYIEVHSVYLFDEPSIKESVELASNCGTGIHMHLLETRKEREESIKKYGMNPVQLCDKYGMFDIPIVAAHCIHMSDDDIDLLKEKGINVVHNPTSNLKLGSGIARVPKMLDKGINVALGTDGAASNNNLNMFEEIALAALIHKGANMDPKVVDAYSAIKMATVNGAKAIGFGGQAGQIKRGMKADIIILDVDKPHFCPMHNPISAIAYTAQGADVETVIVDGKIVMENRKIKTVDEEKVKYMVNLTSKKLY